ncbi:hypothetical protein MBM_01807 [Drepanopeziza brunnea f. sp. 'multigermtubi' MB_m1]|uniref:Uncharacterized protein n=1 Tax=Marssonina brunnea f. sp. multigermtubi (strain MB_m1) TaxID=1072389 RepID=K1WQD8_MARBU|nr:uncharacterized protein MBM_01807 [Drepanopeziza brunnea f. sp. 'multigermtubi' MB_m1]EKD19855.1 hypothetical protein MBM_01807 [Drepanopeziza brunnea f. sp. 'multigermtubi' MB_m1]
MMNTAYGGNPLGYNTLEMLLDDVSKQMASSNLARYPRSSNGQRPGASMRVVKPSSASNSPRGSIGRRRTVMSDGAHRRRLAMIEQQNAMASGSLISNDGQRLPEQRSRPVSWHPASRISPQQRYQPAYQIPISDCSHFQYFDHAAHSGNASPDSPFSPLSRPFNGYEQPQYTYHDHTPSLHSSNSGYSVSQIQQEQQQQQPPHHHHHQQQQQYQEQFHRNLVPLSAEDTDPIMYSHCDWNNFASHAFENSSTTPPTPEDFLPTQHPESTFPATESIPYHSLSLSEPDSDGEELIGMGLYDAPEVIKTPLPNDLNCYRGLMMNGCTETCARIVAPTGKGLKLEESYVPPPSDEEEDGDQDGEGEDDDEAPAQASVLESGFLPPSQPHATVTSQGYFGPGSL